MKKLTKIQELYLEAFRQSVEEQWEDWYLVDNRSNGHPSEFKSPLYGDKCLQMAIRHTEYGRIAMLYQYELRGKDYHEIWSHRCIQFGGRIRRRNMEFERVFQWLRGKMIAKQKEKATSEAEAKEKDVVDKLINVLSHVDAKYAEAREKEIKKLLLTTDK